MGSFTAQDALRSRWGPRAKARAVAAFAGCAVACAVITGLLWLWADRLTGGGYALAMLGVVLALLGALTCAAAAITVQFTRLIGRLLLTLAFPIFIGCLLAIMALAWAPAVLSGWTKWVVRDHKHLFEMGYAQDWPVVSVQSIQDYLVDPPRYADGSVPAGAPGPWSPRVASVLAYVLWPLQFRITRDVLAVIGAIGFVCLFAAFAIWWERKVAGRIQSRLGPMRVGGWHGWAQSMADGIKLIQKEDIYLEGADRPMHKLAPYVSFVPAMVLFLALPFSAAWIARDLDIGLIFIPAMVGVGVIGVLLGGWASNNKWSMYGAMREACQTISYEIPLGFSLLVPVLTAGTLRLKTIGELQAGGFQTWLAFANPFTFAAALLFFVGTLASCKRAPFDLPEAESELVAGYMTEYSGFRWALFMFAEYAEMFAVSALAAVLFFGAWNSPLPEQWGAAWAHGPLWQRALHGVLIGGPLWLIFKGIFLVYVQIWLRWTLPRIRIDQVMHACVHVLLPLAMVVLLGAALWQLLVPGGSGLATVANVACAAVGVAAAVGFVGIAAYGYAHRRRLVGTQAVEHLPGA